MSIQYSRGLGTGTLHTTQTHSQATTPTTPLEITTLALQTPGLSRGSIILLRSKGVRFGRTCPLLPPFPLGSLGTTPWTVADTGTPARSALGTERRGIRTQDRKTQWLQLFNLFITFPVYNVYTVSTTVPIMFLLTILLDHILCLSAKAPSLNCNDAVVIGIIINEPCCTCVCF